MPRSPVPLWILLPALFAFALPAAAQDTTTADVRTQGGSDETADPRTRLAALRARIDHVTDLSLDSRGEDRDLLEFVLARRWQEHHETLAEVIGAEAADSTWTFPPELVSALRDEMAFLTARYRDLRAEAGGLRRQVTEAEPTDQVNLERELSELSLKIDALMVMAVDDVEWDEAYEPVVFVELPPDTLDAILAYRAAVLSARLEKAQDDRSRFREALTLPGVDQEAYQARLDAATEMVRGNAVNLSTMVTLLQRRDLPTERYEQLLIETTGDLGTSLFNARVLRGLVAKWFRSGKRWVEQNTGNVLVKVLLIAGILFASFVLARGIRRAVQLGLNRWQLHISQLLENLILTVAFNLVLALGVLVSLSVLGIDIAPMLAGLGIAGFILGFALQDTLSNFASGLMIMLYQPFDVGDVVEAGGVNGTVQKLTLVSTVVLTFDNQRMVVPNRKVWGDVINNVTAEKIRRVDLVFGIGYADDFERARGILKDIVEAHDLVLADPAPNIRVHELGDSSVNLICRPWSKTSDYWQVYWDLHEEAKRRFDAEGITIPFPQRDVHLYQHGAGDEHREPAAGEMREKRGNVHRDGPGEDEDDT